MLLVLHPSTSNPGPPASNLSLAPSPNTASPMIHKKLMGFLGFSNLPNKVHKKGVRKGFQLTVVGESPSSFIRPAGTLL